MQRRGEYRLQLIWENPAEVTVTVEGSEVFFTGYALHMVAVPEPSTLGLLACGVQALLVGVRRRRA